MPFAERRVDQYPHEFSGGMRQRAMIAMAIANDPAVLIADEPTTALDVTIQAQIVEVLKAAREETQAAIILITHDLGLIAELADRVVVMYAGNVVELADVYTIFNAPRHPYTLGLLNSLARVDADQEWLHPIPGQPPSLVSLPPGCRFHPRCEYSHGRVVCRTDFPELRPFGEGGDHLSSCHFAEELAAAHAKASSMRAAARERGLEKGRPRKIRSRPRPSGRRRPSPSRRRTRGTSCCGSRGSSSTSRSRPASSSTRSARCERSTGSTSRSSEARPSGSSASPGCGKTTLGRTVMKLLEPTAGRIIFDGRDITHFGRKADARRSGARSRSSSRIRTRR